MYANDVDIGGTATFANLATTGNATIGGTLGVTGATTQTGKLTVNNVIEQHGDGIELYYSNPHIDFHYGNSTADFTSRIIENASGILTITPKFSTPNATITTGNITTLNTNAISNAGAIVTRDMEVVDTLKSYKWDISHVANLANDFTVSPTLQLASGAMIQFSAINTSTKVCTFTVKDSSSISSDSLGGVTWTQYSKVKFTMNLNDVVNSNCDGYLTVKMNSISGAMTISGTLDDVTGLVTGTNYNAEGATIMLYEVGESQSTTYPVGIRMTAYGSNKRSYIDIYGGTSTSSWNTPHVRIGNVGGLTFNGETLANQWGIYTDRGYFSGAIVSKEGNIGGFFIDQTNIHNNVTSLTDTSHTGIYLGTDGIRNYNTSGSKHVTIKDGTITANSVDLTGAIKATSGFIGQNANNGFTISNTAICNPSTKSSLSLDTVDGIYLGKDGIALGKGLFKVTDTGMLIAKSGTIGSYTLNANYLQSTDGTTGMSVADNSYTANWAFWAGGASTSAAKFRVTHDGILYATSAEISGDIAANTLHVGASGNPNHLIYENNTIDLSTDWLKFNNNSVIIGDTNKSFATIAPKSFKMHYDDDYIVFEDLRDDNGYVERTEWLNINDSYQITTSNNVSSITELFIGERYTGDGTTKSFSVHNSISSLVSVVVDGQEVSSYTISGNTVTLSAAPLDGEQVNINYYNTSLTCSNKTITFGSGTNGTALIKYTTTDKIRSFQFGNDNGYNTYSFSNGGLLLGVPSSITVGENIYYFGKNSISHGDDGTLASGANSYAGGLGNLALGNNSLVFGRYCIASGEASFACGVGTKADGDYSSALGRSTIASGTYQTVIGRYNLPYTGESKAFIIGNGINYRSNALTVDWKGVVSHYGDVTQSNIRSAITNLVIATNSGTTIPTVSFTKKGNVAMLHMTIKSTGAIGGGSNIFQATLAAKYCPAQYVTGVGYYGNHPIIGRITADGAILVRNVSTSNVTLSDNAEIAFTYILKDYFV